MGDPVNPFDEDGEDGRIHIGDLRPADIALIKSVASVAAAHAVKDTLTALGIDPSEPFAAQADMIWLRTTRERCETAAGKAMLAIIGLIVAGAAGAFWIGFKASIKFILPFMLPLIMLLALAAAALAQGHRHGQEIIDGMTGKFYETWMRPDMPTASCCNQMDCEAVDEVKQANGRWSARRKKDGEWISIPPEKVEWRRDSPDGRSHMCSMGHQVYCFIVGSGS